MPNTTPRRRLFVDDPNGVGRRDEASLDREGERSREFLSVLYRYAFVRR